MADEGEGEPILEQRVRRPWISSGAIQLSVVVLVCAFGGALAIRATRGRQQPVRAPHTPHVPRTPKAPSPRPPGRPPFPPFPPPPPPFPTAEPPDLLPDGSRSIAVCITGELRTFAMPIVHLSLLNAVRAWKAHAYFNYHTHFEYARSVSAKHASACRSNQTAIDLFAPKFVRKFDPAVPDHGCTWSNAGGMWKQLFGILQCFSDADRYARAHDFSYRHYVRLRPDFAFLETPEFPVVRFSQSAAQGHRKHADMFFMVTRTGRQRLAKEGLAFYPHGRCNRLSNQPATLDAQLAILREQSKATEWHTFSGCVRGHHFIANSNGPYHTRGIPQDVKNASLKKFLELQEALYAPDKEWLWACTPVTASTTEYRRQR